MQMFFLRHTILNMKNIEYKCVGCGLLLLLKRPTAIIEKQLGKFKIEGIMRNLVVIPSNPLKK